MDGFCATGIWPLNASAVKFDGMPCNHINITQEVTIEMDDDLSQVPSTPMQGTIEENAALALNSMANEILEEDGAAMPLEEELANSLSFTQLLQAGDIPTNITIATKPFELMGGHFHQNIGGAELSVGERPEGNQSKGKNMPQSELMGGHFHQHIGGDQLSTGERPEAHRSGGENMMQSELTGDTFTNMLEVLSYQPEQDQKCIEVEVRICRNLSSWGDTFTNTLEVLSYQPEQDQKCIEVEVRICHNWSSLGDTFTNTLQVLNYQPQQDQKCIEVEVRICCNLSSWGDTFTNLLEVLSYQPEQDQKCNKVD
ncbi:hypothetical protein GOP47_0031005 [Adiantum capillus-veneris]|nr:hypothetical protein GOP47_0031005 [Adiantum capillus-veneris]